jgi:hypothetical protein
MPNHFCKLEIVLYGKHFPRDPSVLAALASALREHTALQEFIWVDICSRMEAAPQFTALDPGLRALPACPHLRKVVVRTKYASPGALKHLLQLRPATELYLVLEMDPWLALADEIRRGRCNVQRLTLCMVQVTRSEATEAVKALASAIRLDRNLKDSTLRMENGFTEEAGVALAEVWTVNKTLRKIILSTNVCKFHQVQNEAIFLPKPMCCASIPASF